MRKFHFLQQPISTILQIDQDKRKKENENEKRKGTPATLNATERDICESAPIIAYADLKGRTHRLSGSYPLATPSSAPSLQADYRFGKGCPMAFRYLYGLSLRRHAAEMATIGCKLRKIRRPRAQPPQG